MCNPACIEFGRRVLPREEVAGKHVLEVGALDVNGSLRPHVAALGPASYLGVDLTPGPGVDEVCAAENLLERFGPESFDIVLCTEVLEHVRDWRRVVRNLKRVVRPGGILVVTTRSRGFPYHEFPTDFWRYEEEDMRRIFADFTIEALERDPYMPGVFLKARRPTEPFVEAALEELRLWSIVAGRRCRRITGFDEVLFRIRYPLERLAKALLPQPFKDRVRRWIAGR